MYVRKFCLPSIVFAAMVLAANLAWAMGEGLGATKEQLKLKYDVSSVDHGGGRVTVNLTIVDEGRLKPLNSVDLVIPSSDGTGFVDLALSLATRRVDGKLLAEFELARELAERGEIHLKTFSLDGKKEGLTWYYHAIPIAEHLKNVVEYEIYELSKSGTGPKLIAKGKREYSLKDVEVHPYQCDDGRQVAEKLIELEKGYRVGARIFYEKPLTGFGLLAKRSNEDFSWEWYTKEYGNRFEKLQGQTHVTVKTSGMPAVEELSEVIFLEDTKLRFIANSQGMDDTHNIIVKAGSVFRFK